jgi:tRNA A58 N-methylase Trm61
MAKLGFFDIVTIECLNREYEKKNIGFRAIPDYDQQIEAKPEE